MPFPRRKRSIISPVASFTAHFIPAPEGGYTVQVPALPGCLTEGDTFEAAAANAREAIQSYVASLQAHGEPVPQDLESVSTRITVPVPGARVAVRPPRV